VKQFDQHLLDLARVRQPALPFQLTFDDGGESYYTQVADRLEIMGWRAHCFVTTDMIGRPGFLTRAQIRELDERGHHIGSHSASHPVRISACAPDVILGEWTESLQVLQDILGKPIATASVPGGFYSHRVAGAAADAGIQTLFTSEPVTRAREVQGCAVIGRFTIRQASAAHASAGLVGAAPWPRWAEWASWNAKSAIKPILGPAYLRVADWLMAQKAAGR
jgi:peptidoglycan/xylan/chitin deacetylase (PgdA/CDA1 family)